MSSATARLPGTGPVAPGDWLRVDEAYAAQMALRDRLIEERPALVHALLPRALPPARELLDLVLAEIHDRADFAIGQDRATRPDGLSLAIDRDRPLLTLGRLVQQDFCILQREGQEHVLTGAILCFPASWTLAEKLARPLTGIHAPVAPYTDDIARRVQRLFDAVRVGSPLWRVNLLSYQNAELFQPRREADRRDEPATDAAFIRSERQCIIRLPETGAIVFSIHTTVVRRTNLPRGMQRDLARWIASST